MVTGLNRWSSKRDNGEIESKNGSFKHHGARSRSDWSRCIEESWKTLLVKEGGEQSLLYTLDASGPQQRCFQKGMIDDATARCTETRRPPR
jgi:hypothetical protein